MPWTGSTPVDGPKAYSRALQWEDGSTTPLERLERPQVLLRDGAPTHLFLAAKFPAGSAAPNDRHPIQRSAAGETAIAWPGGRRPVPIRSRALRSRDASLYLV